MGRPATAQSPCLSTEMFLPLSESSCFIELLILVWYSAHTPSCVTWPSDFFPSPLISHECHSYMVFPFGSEFLLSALLKMIIQSLTHVHKTQRQRSAYMTHVCSLVSPLCHNSLILRLYNGDVVFIMATELAAFIYFLNIMTFFSLFSLTH